MANSLIEYHRKRLAYVKDLPGLDVPIIPDAIAMLKKNTDAIKFTSRGKFNAFWKKQRHFSVSSSHSYASKRDYEKQRVEQQFTDGAPKYADPNSTIWHETGRQLVAVWDNSKKVGFIIPSNREDEYDF